MFLRSDLKIEENISLKGHGPPCTGETSICSLSSKGVF